jgi:hypothetical protein
MGPWERINIPHPTRKNQNLQVNQSMISLRDYGAELRLIIFRGNGNEKTPFLSPRILLPQLESL